MTMAHEEALEQELAACRMQLEYLQAELDGLAYAVSHDLRAPLRAITGFSEVLLRDYREVLDDTGAQYLSRIAANAKQMQQMIDGLLALSRLAREHVVLDTVDLGLLAQAVVDELRRQEPERQVSVSIADGLTLRGDERLMSIVLKCLLDNTWKFSRMRAHANIEVGAERRPEGTCYVVRDNGVGFDSRHANTLFHPFARLHRADEFEGVGLGLATVRRIVARHGGRVWAEAEADRGATFYFTVSD